MPKVLVVDDETEIRQMLLKYLKREGICGIECENGIFIIWLLAYFEKEEK